MTLSIGENNKPKLNKNISITDFIENYWYVSELKTFCKELGLDSVGGKLEVEERIKLYLVSGIKQNINRKNIEYNKKNGIEGEITNETIIPENILLTPNLRDYFESQIKNKFRFSKELIAYFRNNAGKTIGDALIFYNEIKKNKKVNKSEKTTIPKQCQYNQFIRDYLENNSDKSFYDAVEAWNKLKEGKGNFSYKKNEEI